MRMKTFEPRVKVLDIMDRRESAWNTSRHSSDGGLSIDFSTMSDADLSLNSMRVYTIELTTSAFIRDLIFSLRPIHGWARSIRAQEITAETVGLSQECRFMEPDRTLLLTFLSEIRAGKDREQLRHLLPMSISTTYTVVVDHRVLIGFCKSLEELNTKVFEIYGKLILLEIGCSEAEYKRSQFSTVHQFCGINEEDRVYGLSKNRGIYTGCKPMKIALSSQFLRQHYSKIKTDLWQLVPKYFDNTINQADQIDIAFYIDFDSYRKMMQMRSHWVADWSMDMWGGLVTDFIQRFTLSEFWHFIPNGAGKEDPYYGDSLNRVTGADPGIPCPIMCEWEEMIDWKENQVGENLITRQYRNFFRQGLIKDNPDNKFRKLYLERKKS